MSKRQEEEGRKVSGGRQKACKKRIDEDNCGQKLVEEGRKRAEMKR
jgi:hypothetical protein